MAVMTMRDALNAALKEELARDASVFLMGEEVAEYQGAYKVTRGLLQEFGPKRVIDTPITELGFAGLGVGAAMAGLRPIVEFMTFNFSILATDQIINSAAKMLYMSGGQFKIPIVFRGPGGSAYQVSSQHSQALESWYAYFPGLKVVMPSTAADAKGLLKTAIRDDDPVIFIEGEMLYGEQGDVPDGEHLVPLGQGDIKRAGKDCTVVCYSKMVGLCLEASRALEKGGPAKWVRNEGERIAPGDIIAEVETDKANMDFPLEEEGVLLKHLAAPGETVKLGAPVAILGEAGEDITALLAEAKGQG